MENSQDGAPHRTVFVYVVEASFFSDGEVYGRECYRVAAEDEFAAERLGHLQALHSAYCNARVPDFGLALRITLDLDPDDDPPPCAACLRPICPHCGSNEIGRDASARWNAEAKAWELSDVYDAETCLGCERTGVDFAHWSPVVISPAGR